MHEQNFGRQRCHNKRFLLYLRRDQVEIDYGWALRRSPQVGEYYDALEWTTRRRWQE